MSSTDGELLERWRRGDRGAGEALFERHYDQVERFFLNKTSNAVQDLVQETFARCVAGCARIKDNEKFQLYVLGIAYNVLKTYFREHYRAGLVVPDDVSVRDLNPGPCTLVARHREHRLLLESLRSIPVDEQVVLELHYWENLCTDEIAAVLEIPIGTARGRLQRARARLADVMHRLRETPQELTSTIARLEDWATECREHLESYYTRS